MSLYIDEEYRSKTLADLLIEAQEVAREAWYREIDDRVLYIYRELARSDVRAGRTTPEDHPMFPLASFKDSPFDTVDPVIQKMWERPLMNEMNKLFTLPRHPEDPFLP